MALACLPWATMAWDDRVTRKVSFEVSFFDCLGSAKGFAKVDIYLQINGLE